VEKTAKRRARRVAYAFALVPILVILAAFVWFFVNMFEGEKPVVSVQPLPKFLSKSQGFTLHASDRKRGLRTCRVSLKQGGREITVLEKKFPFKGFLNRRGVHEYEKQIFVDPSALGLAQGEADLYVRFWDYSRRGGGDGNLTLVQHKMIVDTIPPGIRPISRMHNVNVGGSCVVVYQTSSDAQETGVYVDNLFFPGFPVESTQEQGIHVCYFAIPHNESSKPSITLWAKDRAGNTAKAGFYCHVRKKKFRVDRVNITDRFLDQVLAYFSYYLGDTKGSKISKFLKINNDLRNENHRFISKLKEKTSPKKLWEGTWIRLKNAATMARYADHRIYYYKGKKVDEKDHLGIDLASLANSAVQAANSGRIAFAGRLGIYGNTVVIDHGQGIESLYGHLSKIEVSADQKVRKGDIIGYTGQTGLAGGDHLHFSVIVGGLFVNPIEWWDSHWLEDNVFRKLALIERSS